MSTRVLDSFCGLGGTVVGALAQAIQGISDATCSLCFIACNRCGLGHCGSSLHSELQKLPDVPSRHVRIYLVEASHDAEHQD